MTPLSQQRRNLAIIAILSGFLLEAAAGLPFLAPEVIWVSASQAPFLHLVAALLVAGGAAAFFTAGRGIGQWLGACLFFGILAVVIPVAGLFAVLFLSVILYAHHLKEPEKTISLEELPARSTEMRPSSLVHDAGPLKEPLVAMLDRLDPGKLQQVVLGMASMPPAATRPLLQKLQKHADVRVQLYANGLLNDQLDALERRLATLKRRAQDDPGDASLRTAVVETYLTLFENGLVAADEVGQIAGQALRETTAALELDPSNVPALKAQAHFHLLRGEFREAARAIATLQTLPGCEADAARLQARLAFEHCGTQAVPPSPVPEPGSDSQPFSAQS